MKFRNFNVTYSWCYNCYADDGDDDLSVKTCCTHDDLLDIRNLLRDGNPHDRFHVILRNVVVALESVHGCKRVKRAKRMKRAATKHNKQRWRGRLSH